MWSQNLDFIDDSTGFDTVFGNSFCLVFEMPTLHLKVDYELPLHEILEILEEMKICIIWII